MISVMVSQNQTVEKAVRAEPIPKDVVYGRPISRPTEVNHFTLPRRRNQQ